MGTMIIPEIINGCVDSLKRIDIVNKKQEVDMHRIWQLRYSNVTYSVFEKHYLTGRLDRLNKNK